MTIHELSATQAWTAGAKMWITAAPTNSLWSRKLDWYLNFRISKGLTHQPLKRHDHLDSMLQRIDWKLPAETEVVEKPLLIAASLWLPCEWLLVLEDFSHEKTKLASPLEQIATVWSDLGEPKIRIFGPSQLVKDTLADKWPKHELPKEFDFVVE